MCGINGFNFSDEKLIRKMNEKVKHRGPDGDGVFVSDGVSFGHTRLAILDVSNRASQPMVNKDRSIILTFNGEIYNFQDIRKELQAKGHRFFSQSDSEVILAAYAQYGRECLQKFNGIFSLAIFNKKDGTLFLARDRLGIKPLYYYWDKDKFIFSSEIKAILVHNIKREVNKNALNIYLRMLYTPSPLTMFAGIKKLEPGHYLFYKGKHLEKKRYWQVNNFSDLKSRAEARCQIKDLLRDSVRLQLISDRPVGVFLSGGIDSTIITGLAKELSPGKVQTFSVNFDVKASRFNSDAELARRTAKHYGTSHNEFLIRGNDARENLVDVIYHLDEPIANATQIAIYLLSKFSSQKVAVALGGDGGDELFGGYERYRLNHLIDLYQKFPLFLRNTLGAGALNLLTKKHPSIAKLNLLPGTGRYLSFMAQKEEEIAVFFNSDCNNPSITREFYLEHYFHKKINDFPKNFMLADAMSWLPDQALMSTDKMSMAHGLEERVPILDHRLVELSLRIPTKWKVQGRNNKAIFKEAMAEYIPDYLLQQPKRGWFSPTSEWMRTDLKDLVREVLSPDYSPTTQEFFDFAKIKNMLRAHIEKKEYHMNLLWALVTFQMWHKIFIEKNP